MILGEPAQVLVLFRRLTGYRNGGANPGLVKWYDSRPDAHAALSAACVAYGRGLAGLPAPPA